MESQQSVVSVCLILALSICDATLLPPKSRQSQSLMRRQFNIPGFSLPVPPLCGTCVITPGAQLQGVIGALKDLGPVFGKMKSLTGSIVNITSTSVPDMQAALRKALQDVKDTMLPFLGKLSTAAATVTSCLALKDLFGNMNKNLDAVLTVYIQDGPSFITATGIDSVVDAIRKALAKAMPKMFTLLRDLIYNSLQVAFLPLCTPLGPVIYFVFDPNGIGAQLVANFLNTGGNAATSFIKLIFGNLLPGGQAGGTLDQFEIMTKLLCGLVGGAIPGSDIADITGGFCPAGTGSFDLFGFIKDLFCAFLGVVNPSSSKSGACAPGSSDGGNSGGLLGLIGGIACGALNLLGLGGILGLCPAGSSATPGIADQVTFFTGLACDILKALGQGNPLGGIATTFCPSG